MQSLEAMQRFGDAYRQVQALINLASLNWRIGELDDATQQHTQALQLAQELGDTTLEAKVLTGLTNVLRSNRDFDGAQGAIERAVERKRAADDLRGLKFTLLSLGALHRERRSAADAIRAYEKALQLARQQRDPRVEAVALTNLAKLYLGLQQLNNNASAYLDQAEPICYKHGYEDCLVWYCELRGDALLMTPEPSLQQLVRWYGEACVHAEAFHVSELKRLLDNLTDFLKAHVEDGYADEAIAFSEAMVQVWREVYPEDDNQHILVETFESLKTRLSTNC